MDLSECIIVCTQTGTVISAKQAVILYDDHMTEEEWEEFNNMSDSETSERASEIGIKLSDLINS